MQKRISQLDTLRLLAILFIIFYHFIPHIYRGGFLGVNIFLVLAGYLNGSRLEKFWSQAHFHLLPAIKNLLVKLYKPLLLFIGLISTYLVLFNREFINNWLAQVFSNLFFVNNWYQIIEGASYFDEILQPSLLTHLWYLSVYVQFILFYWLLIKLTKPILKSKSNFLLVIATLTLTSAILMAVNFDPGSDPTRVYYGSDTRFFSFGIGIIASQISLKKIQDLNIMKKYGGIVQFLLFIAICFLLFEMTDVGSLTYYGGMIIFDLVLAGFIISLASKASFFSRLLTFKPFAFLGQKSLGIYLWYYPVFILSQRIGFTWPAWLQSITSLTILIFLLGLITDFVVTKPILTAPNFNGNNLKDGLKAYLTALSLKGKLILGFQLVLCIFTLTAFALSTDTNEADRYRTQYSPTSSQENQSNLQNYSEEDIQNYLNNLNQDQAFYTEPFTEEELTETILMDVTFIGDSIMLGASAGLNTLYPDAHINAEVGRQLYNAAPLVQELNQEGLLSPIVVISLGSNGPFTSDQFDEFIDAFDPEITLFFVTTHVNRPWRDSVNDMLHSKAGEYDHIHVIDWYSNYQNIDEPILDTDDLHLNPEGRRYWISHITRYLLDYTE